jgi:hypothetical protein
MTQQGRNPNDPIDNLAVGKLIEVDGTHIVSELDPGISELSRVFRGETYPIGQFGSIVKVHFGRRIIYGYVGRLRMKTEYEREHGLRPSVSPESRVIEADLFGEGEWIFDTEKKKPVWELRFDRGISTYPLPQQTLYLTPTSELRFIYGHRQDGAILIGEHVGTGGTPCYGDLNELLGKHTAVLGSTGTGKSGTVAAILHAIVDHGRDLDYAKWNPRIVVLDPHNEYHAGFPNSQRLSTDEGTLRLPYWLLNLAETLAIVVGKTEFVATSQANIVKKALLEARKIGATKLKLDPNRINVDSPVPYCLDEFTTQVKADMPSQQSKQESHASILNKLEVLRNDARMAFLMAKWDGSTDPFGDVVAQLMGDQDRIKIVDLSGVPNEVAGVASSVIARTLFSYKIWQTPAERERCPLVLVCEEAHRYVPNRGEAQYEAAQEAVRRIAKEGRKYGLGLVLVSQRPSEVEATVLSQCNSWLILRLTNETDREHVRAVLPDSLSGLTKLLSGLRRREAIFVGQAILLPSRIMVRRLLKEQLPRSSDIDFDKGWQNDLATTADMLEIGRRWRYQDRAGNDVATDQGRPPVSAS